MKAGLDIADWLRQLDLARYKSVFRDNAVDLETLPELGEVDLEKLGVLLGHRKKMLRAIALLTAEAASVVAPPMETLAAGRRSEAAERRQLTLLFCDIVNSTVLATQLDPEDLREILAAYIARTSEVIERFGGFIARFLGDGILAYFGYPRAQEHDPEQALRAGLALVDTIARLQIASGQLQVRVGVATGLVVVGDLVAGGAGQEHEVVGETPNLACRLQDQAEPNGIVVSPRTRQLVGDLFEFRDLGPRPLKGFAEPVRVWRLLGERAIVGRFEALRAHALTPLVGRQEELTVLARRWQQAKAGEGQMVLISGEPGIGKSRIMAAFEEGLAGEAHVRLRLFCSPHHQNSALYPAIAHLERAAGFIRGDSPAAKLDKLKELLSLSGETSAETVALFAELMDLPGGEQSSVTSLSAQRRRELTLAAMVRQLEAQARQQPVYLTVEDVHWIDATSLELIDIIAARVPQLAILLSMSFRPEFQPPWIGQAHVTTIALNRLYRRDAATIVSRVAGDKPLPADIVGRIIERADGIPLFIEELTKALLESGTLRERNGVYVMDGALRSSAIPSSLHASLMARLDRLSPVKEVAQIGAALGRSFPYDLLAAVGRLGDVELRDALDRLAATGLVSLRGVPPNAIITFKHALIQDAAYASLLRRSRQELHMRIGRVLEERFPETAIAQPELLAHHYAQAGLIETAIDFWRRAGERALRRSAHVEGVTHLTRAVELVRELPPSGGRDRRELELHLALGQMMRATKGYAAPETLRVFARARELLDHSGIVNDRTAVLYGLWSVHYVRAEHAAAREVAERSLAFAAEHADVDAAATANLLMACSLLAAGDFDESHHRFIRTQELSATDDVSQSRFTKNHGVAARSMVPWALWSLGYPDQAVVAAKEAVLLARARGHVPLTASVLFVGAFLGTALGAGGELAALAKDAEVYCVEHSVIAYREWAPILPRHRAG